MAEVQTLPMRKPDIRITLSWDEAEDLRDTLAAKFGNDDLYKKIHALLRTGG